jgi:hypothetical protein
MQQPTPGTAPAPGVVTIRWAQAADLPAVRRLAALDTQAAPCADELVLLAEVDGELWAAASADRSRRLADPFRPSGGLLELLLARVAQQCGAAADRPRMPRMPRPRGLRRWLTAAA